MTDGVQIHERYFKVREAHLALGEVVLKIIQDHGLTYHEAVSILLEEAQSWSKYGIRFERHPDDPYRDGEEA